MDMTHITQGDTVIRLIAGKLEMPMRVLDVEGDLISCTLIDLDAGDAIERGLIWTFDRKTGLEIDDGLEWGPRWQRTGSELVATNPDERELVAPVLPEPADPMARTLEILTITKPVEGLEELYERDRARFANETAERIFGRVGRMIAASKTSYWKHHPTQVPVWNANVCTEARGKIWFGDLDLTRDEPALVKLAAALDEPLYVLFERDARFGTEETPLLHLHVLKVNPSGNVAHPAWIVRGEDRRLHRRTRTDD
jgi:hypothetical protein